MFGTIRRHQTWLWIIIIIPMIISFIIYFNPATKSGGGGGGLLGFLRGRQSPYGTIDNQPVTDEQLAAAKRDVLFPRVLSGRQMPPANSPELTYQAYQGVFFAAQEDRLGIHPTADAAADLAHRILGGAGSYDAYVDQKLKPVGLTGDDFDHFLRSEIGRNQLATAVSVSGRLVTPAEAESLFRAEHRALVTKFVWFPASNYVRAVAVTGEAVARYYTNELAAYSIPDRVQVGYVQFDASNYLAATKAAMTNLDRDVEDAYARSGTNLFPGAKSPEEAKARARAELLRRGALKAARRDAYGLADELDRLGNHAGDLQKLAQDKKLTLHTTEPFDETTGPTNLGLPEEAAASFAQAAFQLTDDAPFNHDLVSTNAVYVMGLKQKFPSVIPPLKDVVAKVTADYQQEQAYGLAQQAATNFVATVAGELNVNNGVTLPKTFTDICNETGNQAGNPPPFSLSTTNLPPEFADRVDLKTLKQAGFSTPVGSVSAPVSVPGGAFVLYVDKMLPVDESLVKDGVAEYLELLRTQRENDAFQLWTDSQIRQDPGALHIFEDQIQKLRDGMANAQQPAR